MPERLRLVDADTARDVLTFVGRARLIGTGGVRVQAAEGVLALTAPALAPQGIGDATPTILAMRAVGSDPELICDLVISELGGTDDPSALELPESALAPSWAALAPPRTDWTRVGALFSSQLATHAHGGIAEVARAVGSSSGEELVRAVRADVWGAVTPDLAGLPRGVAFAAYSFGFIQGEEEATVTRSGPWTRISLRRGYVLTRGPVAVGLTPVRTTGAPREPK